MVRLSGTRGMIWFVIWEVRNKMGDFIRCLASIKNYSVFDAVFLMEGFRGCLV